MYGTLTYEYTARVCMFSAVVIQIFDGAKSPCNNTLQTLAFGRSSSAYFIAACNLSTCEKRRHELMMIRKNGSCLGLVFLVLQLT